MSTKAAEATQPEKSTEPILYDAREPQRIPLVLRKNGKEYDVAHNLAPLSDDSYFQLLVEAESDLKQLQKGTKTKVNSDTVFGAKYKVWQQIATSREGYTERDDWKEKTHRADCSHAIDILLTTILKDPVEDESTDLFDDDELTVVPFHTMYNGILLTGMSHSFTTESKAQLDEYIAIETSSTNPNALASAEQVSEGERLCRLGRKLIQGQEGYAPGSPVPAWHLVGTTRAFFLRQMARMGKF